MKRLPVTRADVERLSANQTFQAAIGVTVESDEPSLVHRLIEALDEACEVLATMDYEPRALRALREPLNDAKQARKGGAI